MSTKVLLGIDAGTSSVKVVAFTLSGVLVGRVSKKNNLITPRPGLVELDPVHYSNLMKSAIKQLVNENNLDVLGIGFSSACPCITFMDESYQPIGNSITYLDNRAEKELDQYVKKVSENGTDYFERIGNRASISTCFSCTIKWVKTHEVDRWEATKHIGMLNSFLAAELTGSSAVDYTQASYSGIFNLSEPESWDKELVELSGIDPEKLLPILPSYEKVGILRKEIADELYIREGVAVAIGSGDTAAAAFGLGFTDPNRAFESAGTSGVLTFCLDSPNFNPVFMNRCHVIPGKWLAHGATSMNGGSIDWLRHNIFEEYVNPSFIDTISSNLVRGAGGVVFLPYLAGERSPIWNCRAKAIWYGMDINTTKYDLIEAVLEASAFSLNQIKNHALKIFGINLESIIAVGNGTKCRYLSQLKADVFSTDYVTTNISDYAAWGAALMGGCAAQLFDGPSDVYIELQSEENTLYSPHCLTEAVSKNFVTYEELYPSLVEVMNKTYECT